MAAIFKNLFNIMPLIIFKDCRAKNITFINRLSNLIFGSPNWRRANGVISTKFEASLMLSSLKNKLKNLPLKKDTTLITRTNENNFYNDSLTNKGHSSNKAIPVFQIDRRGTRFNETLPRVWLSERAYNTSQDCSRRVFVECYPNGFDYLGLRALELADCYIGEGIDRRGELSDTERIECFKAAELLLAHAIARGNNDALQKLEILYQEDLCKGDYWQTSLETHAKHARKE